jgi:hypothetical protein
MHWCLAICVDRTRWLAIGSVYGRKFKVGTYQEPSPPPNSNRACCRATGSMDIALLWADRMHQAGHWTCQCPGSTVPPVRLGNLCGPGPGLPGRNCRFLLRLVLRRREVMNILQALDESIFCCATQDKVTTSFLVVRVRLPREASA